MPGKRGDPFRIKGTGTTGDPRREIMESPLGSPPPAGGKAPRLRTLWRVRKIAIVGAGQSGAQLALGLLGHGYQVTLVSDRDAGELLGGHVLSSQCMFETALQAER